MSVKRWAALVGFIVLGCGYYLATKPLAVRAALPLRAIIFMDEHYRDFAPLPDFVHCVKVEVSEEEFERFTSEMELVPFLGADGFPACDVQWWAPSSDASQAFYYPSSGKESSVMVKRENGALFYVAQAW